MISITHNITDSYAACGLDHFLTKYGIVARISQDEKADIEIRCADSPQDDTQARILIQIAPNEIQPRVKGYVNAHGELIPLFETPRRLTADGKAIAAFEGQNGSYPCVILNDNCLGIGFDIFNEIGRILSGHLETIFNEPSDRGKELMKVPVVDALEELLFTSLRPICHQRGIELETKPFWPEGKKFALCLTHDVDRVYKTYQYIPSILKSLKRVNPSGVAVQIKSMLFKHGKNNPYWTFDKIMDLENELGVKSTFFFLNESGKLNPFSLKSWVLFAGRYKIDSPDIVEIMRRLHDNGFEIGIHGSYYSYKDLKLLEAEKEKLENIIGDKIRGIRQHYLNFDQTTFKLQESAGFEYDTTVGFEEAIGFRRGTCFPYHPFDSDSNRVSSLLEIPLIVMDGAIPAGQGILDQCMEIMDIVERSNGVLTLLWHQNRFSEADFPNMTEIYQRLVKAAQSKNAWTATASELQKWIINRKSKITPSYI